MSSPLQLTVPEGAQVHIHLGPLAPVAGALADGVLLPEPAARAAAPRRPLRLALAGLLVFGGGYLAHGLVTPPAVAQAPEATTLALPPSPALAVAPSGAVLGNTVPGLPSSIHIAPLPGLPSGVAPGQVGGQVPGPVIRSPYAPLPGAPQVGAPGAPQASLPVPPVPTRNLFGLE